MGLWEAFRNLLYIETLEKENISVNINKDIYYSKLVDGYFEEKGILLDINQENKKIIYNWALDKWRFKILNELLDLMVKRLIHKENINDVIIDSTDAFLYHNVSSLILLMANQLEICLKNHNVNKVNITALTKEDRDIYIKELLAKIDPSLSWYNIYLEALNKNRIVYLNELSKEVKDKLKKKLGIDLEKLEDFVINIEGINYIFLTLHYNMMDIPNFVHEFAHYVSYMKKTQNIPLTLREFVSCFYELFSLLFLKTKGIKDEELMNINSLRLENSKMIIMDEISLVNYLETYLKKGEITYEEEYQRVLEANKRLVNFFSPEQMAYILKINPDFGNIDKEVKESCDKCLNALILNPWVLIDSYPYIVGNYLAIQMIQNRDENTLSLMKKWAEELDKVDPYDIFEKIGKVDSLKLKRARL